MARIPKKFWRRWGISDGGDDNNKSAECDDPECKSCGGTGWIAICKACLKPLSKHSYKDQQVCSTKLMNEEFQ